MKYIFFLLATLSISLQAIRTDVVMERASFTNPLAITREVKENSTILLAYFPSKYIDGNKEKINIRIFRAKLGNRYIYIGKKIINDEHFKILSVKDSKWLFWLYEYLLTHAP